MGSTQSSPTGSTRGYHVLKVVPGSPGDVAGLEPYFDYLVAINGELLDEESSLLITVLTQNLESQVLLHVFSAKYQDLREVTLVPSRTWGKSEDGLIGCSVRFCDYAGSGENVWHILEIYDKSPAQKAGLKAHSDYIIGSPQATLRDQQDLYDLVERSLGQPLQLFVYNKDVDSVREVLLVPNDSEFKRLSVSYPCADKLTPNDQLAWGGPGTLGCDIGYGYIHRIPTIKRGPLQTPYKAEKVTGAPEPSAVEAPIISSSTVETITSDFENVGLHATSMPATPHQTNTDQIPLEANSMPPPPPTGGFIKAVAPTLPSGLRYGGGTIRGIQGNLGLRPLEDSHDHGGHDKHSHDGHSHGGHDVSHESHDDRLHEEEHGHSHEEHGHSHSGHGHAH
ncbi:hypothetical protein SmJEL517_g01690 [Synchytrium microbalum]|uniref:PDZ GRASP-type domain-containing protein n=1 Tax=Synchytrium microbalum TaxID=1806994 RepID=A0A507C8M5_9FUNG|nr:uncharacterized protein SmJEL517_g01690 [Synchytrium microbalum]TPX35871.1 hypothetical protein SmJEL517_g01690 [Synchytrium microbalum]